MGGAQVFMVGGQQEEQVINGQVKQLILLVFSLILEVVSQSLLLVNLVL